MPRPQLQLFPSLARQAWGRAGFPRPSYSPKHILLWALAEAPSPAGLRPLPQAAAGAHFALARGCGWGALCFRLQPPCAKVAFCPGLGMKRIAPHAGDPGHRHCFPAYLAFWAPPTFAFNFPPAWGINPSQTLVDLLPDHGVHRSHFGSRYKLG